jgi:hypothetical protein
MSFEGSIFSLNKHIFQNASMTGDLTSEILDLGELTGYAVHAIWTGIPDGDIIVSGSNTANLDDFVPVDLQATAGVDGAHLLNVEKCHYRYVLVQYVANADTGVLNCRVSGKRI